MKYFLTFLSLLHLASVSYASSFPTGSFKCIGNDSGYETTILATVTEVKLGAVTLPLIELQFLGRQGSSLVKGIATIRYNQDPQFLSMTPAGPPGWSIVFNAGKLVRVGGVTCK